MSQSVIDALAKALHNNRRFIVNNITVAVSERQVALKEVDEALALVA